MKCLILVVVVCIVAVQATPYVPVRRGGGFNQGSNMYDEEFGNQGQSGYQQGGGYQGGRRENYDTSRRDEEFTQITRGKVHDSRSTGSSSGFQQGSGGSSGFNNYGQGGRRRGQDMFEGGFAGFKDKQ